MSRHSKSRSLGKALRNPKSLYYKMFKATEGKCCYCGNRMLIPPEESFNGKEVFKQLFASKEHLKRRTDGLPQKNIELQSNIALAHVKCNEERHHTNWLEWKSICMNELHHMARKFK